jgi:hypothetical protein
VGRETVGEAVATVTGIGTGWACLVNAAVHFITTGTAHQNMSSGLGAFVVVFVLGSFSLRLVNRERSTMQRITQRITIGTVKYHRPPCAIYWNGEQIIPCIRMLVASKIYIHMVLLEKSFNSVGQRF